MASSLPKATVREQDLTGKVAIVTYVKSTYAVLTWLKKADWVLVELPGALDGPSPSISLVGARISSGPARAILPYRRSPAYKRK